jgi:tetratricopeptide (TPR) repeat protein
LDSAIEHYEAGLEAQPMWPVGWFNLALIYAEQNNYVDAADRMKHYLELASDAPDAQSAREQMTIWDDKARQTSSLGAANR